MQQEIKLRLDVELIEAAERYAKTQGISVSDVVASYLRSLYDLQAAPPTHDEATADWKASLSPIVRRLVGAGQGGSASYVDEDDYHHHLERKHSCHLHDEADAA